MDDRDLDKIAARVASGRLRTAGKIEFVKDTGPIRRDIRVKGFEWTPDSARNLAKILWAAQRSHSYALAAYRLFSKMPSSQFSPDGLLGGRGYIQSVKEMRNGLGSIVETLSSFTDTVHDEVNADHWSASGAEDQVSDIVDGAEDVKQNPEAFVESEFRADSGEDGFNEPVQNPDPEDFNPLVEDDESEDDESEDDESEDENEEAQHQFASYTDTAIVEEKIRRRQEKEPAGGDVGSQLPGGTGDQEQGKTVPEMVMNTTTPAGGNYASAVGRILRRHKARSRTADASLPTGGLTPRVDHIGPAEGNEAGHFNDENVWPSDDPTGEGLSSGTNESKQLLEDWTVDGVTGYDNPTDGDSSVLKISSRVAAGQTYSWLPGCSNDKNLDYYARGLTAEDVDWMKAHAAPEPPPGLGPQQAKRDTTFLWDADF